MMRDNKRDVSKLPVWAQEELKKLQSEIATLKSHLAQHESSTSPTKIRWGNPSYGTYGFIKNYETVQFTPTGNKNQEILVHLTNDNAVNVHCTLGQLVVCPHSGNWVKIYTERDYRKEHS